MQPGRREREAAGRGCRARIQRAARFLRRGIRQASRRPGDHCHAVRARNQWHGSAFEFLRNNDLDAPNFFDQGSAPPFQRNQFGVVARRAGPEGQDISSSPTTKASARICTRPRWHLFPMPLRARPRCPACSRCLNLWPIAPAGRAGLQRNCRSLQQSAADDSRGFWNRCGWTTSFPSRIRSPAIYTIDDGGDVTATPVNPFSTDILTLREQVVSLEETHVFSPATAEHGAIRLFARGIFLYRRADAGHSGGERSRFSSRDCRGRGGGWWKRGVESASRDRTGRKQQRKQSGHRAQSIHLRRSRDADARHATN